MGNQLGFLLKLLLFSGLLSVLIKYASPSFWIPATTTNVLIMVLLPTVIMATVMLWRIPRQKQNVRIQETLRRPIGSGVRSKE